MHKASVPYEPSAGLWYALAGVICFVVGGSWLTNASNDPSFAHAAGLALIAVGLYLLVVGGVARGSQLARRSSPATTSSAPAQSTPTS